MEIGSFIEFQLPRRREYHRGETDIARLNSGRAALWYAFRCTGCRVLWLPYYQCDSVRDYLLRQGCELKYYHIDDRFDPVDLTPAAEEAVLLVNYYGVMSHARMTALAKPYSHVVIDNAQAFFAKPVEGAYNVCSARKFVGAPDGAYVIGPDAQRFLGEYEQGFSSDAAVYLLERIEYGCEGKAYADRARNEERIENEGVRRMSKLTRAILDGTDYAGIIAKRRENFAYAHRLFGAINKLDPMRYYADDCVPMVYPLLAEDDGLLRRLLDAKHFQGHWWSYLLEEMPEDSFEYYVSRYVIPITIDQRYGREELDYLRSIVG